MLAYEMSLSISKHHDGKELVGYIHPHYYFDAKAVHDILFYPVNSQKETDDDDGSCFKILKSIIEDDRKVHLRIKRHSWLPRFVNDRCEKIIARSYLCARFKGEGLNKYYRILPGKDIADERMRILYLWDGDGGEVVYKMTACKNDGSTEYMTFEKSEK